MWIKVDQSHVFNLPDELKIKISEKLMIHASAKYVNLGIKLKTPLCNRPNEILPKGKGWTPQTNIFQTHSPVHFQISPNKIFLSPLGK